VFNRQEKAFFKDFSVLCNNFPHAMGGSRLARQTMTNYLRELETDGFLERKTAPGDKYAHYRIPKDRLKEVAELKEKHQLDLDFANLSVEEKMAKTSMSLREREKDQILYTLALNGWLRIPEIVEKTGIDEKRVVEDIWGKVDEAGRPIVPNDPAPLIHWLRYPEEDSKWPRYMRSYGLSFSGAYWALKKYPESCDIIMEKWSEVHSFIFQRFSLFKKHELEDILKIFINKLDPVNFHLNKEETVKDIEDGLISSIPRNGGKILNWFDLLQEDRQFRERVKAYYKEGIEYCKRRIVDYEMALKAMDNLGSKKPDKVQIQRDMGFFVGAL
jgi:hypothetical protein